jgi:hypothetical protein
MFGTKSSLWFDPIGARTHDLPALEASMPTPTPLIRFKNNSCNETVQAFLGYCNNQ